MSDLVSDLRKLAEVGIFDAGTGPLWTEAANEIERLREKVGFWMRNSERNREQARLIHDSYLRLWAEHGGPELPERLRDSGSDRNGENGEAG